MAWKVRRPISLLALTTGCAILMQFSSPVYAQSLPSPASGMESSERPRTDSLSEQGTRLLPSLRLAERYDSNVFFRRGANLEDFVTMVSPQLQVTHKNQWVEAVVEGGATGEVYVKNPGLNYVGGNGTIDLNLDGAMNALVRGLKLRITNSGTYTPQPAAFGAPASGSRLSEALVQGIQARRANSFMNDAKVEATYFLSPYLGVTSTYTDSRIRFGRGIATPTGIVPGEFINTNFQTVSSGLIGMPTSDDTVSLLHQYRTSAFSDPVRGERGFSTQGAVARWSRSITPSLKATLEGGFSVLNSSSNVYTMGGVALEWWGQFTSVEISYKRSITPSFLFASTALLSNVVTGMVTYHLTQPLSLSLSGNYAVNHSVPESSLLRYESYSVTPSLDYRISRNLTARLSYTRSQFQRTLSGEPLAFDRNMVMINLLAEWR